MISIFRVFIFLFIITSMLFIDVLRAIDSDDGNSPPSQSSSPICSSPSHSSVSDSEENTPDSPSAPVRTSSEPNRPATSSLGNQAKEETSLLNDPPATGYGSLRGRPTWQIVRSNFSEEEDDLNLRKEGQVDEPQSKLCCFNFCLRRGSSHGPDPKKAEKGLQLAPSIQQNSVLNL